MVRVHRGASQSRHQLRRRPASSHLDGHDGALQGRQDRHHPRPIVTTHGPFAETKEQLGGYYVLNCKDLDEAIAWASKCPGARTGSLELRPIVDFSQMG